MHESCRVWTSNVAYEWVMSHTNEPRHMHKRVMSHMNESCHMWRSQITHEWVMSHMNKSSHTHTHTHTRKSQAGHMHRYVWIRHVSPINRRLREDTREIHLFIGEICLIQTEYGMSRLEIGVFRAYLLWVASHEALASFTHTQMRQYVWMSYVTHEGARAHA